MSTDPDDKLNDIFHDPDYEPVDDNPSARLDTDYFVVGFFGSLFTVGLAVIPCLIVAVVLMRRGKTPKMKSAGKYLLLGTGAMILFCLMYAIFDR